MGNVLQEDLQEIHKSIIESLSPQQATALEELRKRVINDGSLTKSSSIHATDVCDGISDESTLLQLSEACAAREALNLHSAYDGIAIEDFEWARNLYLHWTGRRDMHGSPICVFGICKLDSDAISSYRKLRVSVSKGSSSELVHKTYHQLPISRGHIELQLEASLESQGVYSDISKVLAGSYPEVIDHVFVLGAPPYFSKIWAWVKAWIDPGTASKMVILQQAEVLPTLIKYIDIENIPKRYGGKLEFEHGMSPRLGSVVVHAMSWLGDSDKTLPRGPVKWTIGPDDSHVAVAVGSCDGSLRFKKFATISE
ncbi:CRAL/TRIO domain-containing protein [Glonium stellatum]|uniref:CRAL/TRIO domain-containing protein n=1 Tax=Glonium stellatum TaxID=574774 RepID=A0A8E2F4P5_9PEZI|nr:CRAL/TRIO domain-containing protein [Glonium stellatum]